MFRVQLKTITPPGAALPQTLPGYLEAFASLSGQISSYLEAAPAFEDIENGRIRIDEIASLANIRQKHTLTNAWGIENGVDTYRVANNVTRYLKIENIDTNQVVLDWTQIPELAPTEFVAWLNETIV